MFFGGGPDTAGVIPEHETMAESTMTRRDALCIAGAFFTVGCSSREDRPVAAAATNGKPAVDNVTTSWERIHTWLSQQAPKILANLNPPATDQEITEAEKIFGMEMPADWRDLYRGHNGMNSNSNLGSLFYCLQFLSLERAAQELKTSAENTLPVRASDAAIRKDDIYNAKWIAIAHDGGDTLIRVDMDPAPSGNSGQVIFTDHADDTAILLHRSVAELLSEFVRDLEAGRYFLNKEALVDGNQFLDCDSDIDVVNWARSPRWKHLSR